MTINYKKVILKYVDYFLIDISERDTQTYFKYTIIDSQY